MAALAALVGIVGPTASGKSALALRLARERDGEIISCDSLQVYRGLDIGSAKPTTQERSSVPHHLIDILDPGEDFSAAEYARRARQALGEIRARGRLPVVAGGTGLYLRALLGGLFEGPSRDAALRSRFEALADRFGDERLHRLLRHADPEASQQIAARDRVRIVRALEVLWVTGRPISEARRAAEGTSLTGFEILLVGLSPDRVALRAAVEQRVEAMWARGFVEEVRGLLRAGHPSSLKPFGSIGYRQIVGVVERGVSEAEARRDIVTKTMQYAKRQLTWFRHQAEVQWFADADSAHRGVCEWLDDPARS